MYCAVPAQHHCPLLGARALVHLVLPREAARGRAEPARVPAQKGDGGCRLCVNAALLVGAHEHVPRWRHTAPSGLLAEAIRRIHNGASVSALFATT